VKFPTSCILSNASLKRMIRTPPLLHFIVHAFVSSARIIASYRTLFTINASLSSSWINTCCRTPIATVLCQTHGLTRVTEVQFQTLVTIHGSLSNSWVNTCYRSTIPNPCQNSRCQTHGLTRVTEVQFQTLHHGSLSNSWINTCYRTIPNPCHH
jgi:hypothetical protein